MSEAVDTRIVEAKFDSAQFEKGVDKTVKKLDELKKSLQLDEAGKSIAQLADKTKDATEKASSSLQQLEERFTNFAGMLKQKLLGGIADEVVGMFFKIKNGFENLVKSLSSTQVTVGMSKYEQMLTSVRTMIAAGDTENAAYEAIDTLGKYADQTSYSLDQMTSALSKMRAAGVDLETGTRAVEGISNACAAAGVNATDASRAFFNLSQAYSSGYLKYTDYRSLELLNMTTEKFKLQMLDAAVAAGTLKKLSDGVYQTVNKNDKKVSAGKKITVKNLSDALRYNFMNTEALNKLFGEGFFFDEKEWKKIKDEVKAAGKSEEEALALAKERFGDVAVNAYFAAREARSFTDVMNTLRDVVSRGWSYSFELIFGRLEEAKDFFTALTESNLANAIYNISEFRNQILEHWSYSGGRDNLVEALENIDNLIGRILGHFTIFSDSESPRFQNATLSIGHRLSQASRDFKAFTERLDAWFTEERIARIQKSFNTIGTVLSTVFRALGIAFNFATKIFETFEPIIGKIIDNVDKVVNKISSIFNAGKSNNKTKDGLDSLQTGLDNVVKAVEPLIEPLGKVIDFLGDVASFLIEIAAGSFVANLDFLADTLGFILELFGIKSAQQEQGIGVLEGMKNSIAALGDACKESLTFVKDFFHNLYEDVLTLLGIHELPEGEEGGFFSNITKFFDTSEFLANIKKRFEKLPDDINRIIYGNKKYRNKKENGKVVGLEAYYEGGLINIFKNAFETVKTWVTTKFPAEVKKLLNGIDEFLFGKKVGMTRTGKNGQTESVTVRMKSGFSEMIDNMFKSIREFVTVDIPKQAKEIWDSIIGSLFSTTADPNNKADTKDENKSIVKDGFVKWFEQAIQDVKNWIATIPEKISEIWNTIIDFIFYRDPKVDEVKPGTDEKYGPNDRVKNGLLLWIEAIPGHISTWIKDLPEKVKDVWNKVLDFIFGEYAEPGQVNPETGQEYGPNERVKEGFSAWLDSIVRSVSSWLNDAPDKITSIWDTVLAALFGNDLFDKDNNKNYSFDQTVYEKLMTEDPSGYGAHQYEQWCKAHSNPILDAVKNTVETLGLDIGKIMSNIPAHIVKGWNFTLGLTNTFFENLTEYFKGKNEASAAAEAGDEIANVINGNADDMAKEIEVSAEASPLLSAVITFGQNIGKLVTTTIPGVLSEAWTFLKTDGINKIGIAIRAIFGLKENWWTDLNTDAEAFGNKVAETIRNLPDKIRTAFETVKDFFSGETELKKIKSDIRKRFTVTDEDGNIQIVDPKGLKVALNAAENEFRKTHGASGLLNAVKEMFGATGDVIKDIGPDILDGINTVLNWLGEKLMLVTKAFETKQEGESIVDAITRTVTGQEGGDKEPSALAQALGRIGESIKNLIVNIIPGFIKSGVNVVAEKVPEIFEGLFGGGDNNGKTWVNKMYESMSTKLKENNPLLLLTGKGGAMDELLKQAGNAAPKMGKVEDLIKEYEAKYTEVTQRIASAGMKRHTPNPEDQVLAKDYLERLQYYRELQVKGIKEVAESADGSTVSGIDNAKKATDGAIGIIESLSNLSKSDTLGTVAIIAALGWVLHELKDITSISDELESPGYTAKWVGIGLLITAVTTIFGYMTYLIAAGKDAQFDKMSKMFGDLGAFLEKLAWIGVLMKGFDAAGNVAEAIGNKNSAQTIVKGASGAATNALVTSGQHYLDIIGIIGAVSLTGSTIMESIQMWIGDLSTSFSLMEAGFNSLSRAADTIISIGEKVPAAIDAIVREEDGIRVFFDAIMHIFEEDYQTASGGNKRGKYTKRGTKVDYANDIIEVIQTLTEISGYFSLIKNAFSGDNIHAKEVSDALSKIIGLESKMKEFAEFAESDEFGAFKYAIGSLGAALSMYTIDANAKIINADQVNAAIDVFNEILKDSKISDLGKALTESGSSLPDAKEIYTQAEKISMIAKATASIGVAAKLVTANTAGQINTLFTELSKIEIDESVTRYVGEGTEKNSKITKLANVFGILGNAISTFANNSKDLQTMNIESVEKTINMTISLMAALRTYAQGVFEKVFSGDASIESFGTSFAAFASNLNAGLNILGGSSAVYDADKLTVALKAMSAVAGIYGQMMATIYEALHGASFNHDIGFTALVAGLAGEGGLANALGSFCEEITKDNRFNLTDENVKNIDRVFHVIDHLSKFAAESNGVDFGREMGDLGDALNNRNPFTALAQAVAEAKTLMDENPEKYDKIELVMDAFGKLIQGIAMLASYTKDTSSNLSGRWVIGTLVADLGTMFVSLHDNIGSIEAFLNDVDALSLDKITKANMFFEGIYYLANTMKTFADSSMFAGSTNFSFFNWGEVIEKISESFTQEGATNNLYTVAETIGKNFDAGLANGISTGKAIDAAQTLADQIKDIFPFVWKEHSPSKLAEMYARYLDEGFAIGIEKNSGRPTDAAGEMAKDIIDEAKSVLNDPTSTSSDKSYAQGIIKQMLGLDSHAFGQSVKNEAKPAIDAIEDVTTTIRSITEDELRDLEKANSKPGLLDRVWGIVSGIGKSIIDSKFGSHMSVLTQPIDDATETISVFGDALKSEWDIDWEHAFDETDEVPSMPLDLMLTPERAAKIAGTLKDVIHGAVSNAISDSGDSMGDLNILGTILQASADSMPDSVVALFIKDTFDQIRAALDNGADLDAISDGIQNVLSESFINVSTDNAKAEALAENINDVVNAAVELSQDDANISPEISPVLVITDDFRTAMNDINTFISNFAAFNSLLNSSADGSLTVNATSTGLAEQFENLKVTDYSALIQEINSGIGSLQKDIQGVSTNLGSMKFVINGKEFAYTIGPDINEYLGYEDATRGGRYDTWTQMGS